MKKVFIGLLTMVVFSVNAQNFEDLLASGSEDASVYLGNYLKPVFKGLIYDLNGGWYHTGKTHKKYGFDLTVNVTASIVPDSDKIFTFRNSNYTNLELSSGLTSDDLPSVMGQTSDKRISIRIPIDALGNVIPSGSAVLPTSYRVASFETLDGIEDELPIAAVPAPMIQFGIGLPSKTDVKLRFVPNVGNEDVTFNLFGIGLQHNLLQHFKLADKAPLIDVSLLAAFTTSTTVYAPQDSSIGVNQETIIKVNAYTAQIVGNFDLKIISFYAGLGYVAGSSSTNVNGDYTFHYDLEDTFGIPIAGQQEETIHDPINIDYTLSGAKATLGMRLNIAWFKIFADYTFQEYNTANAGIAFSFR
jgi:hypothetical protein